MREAALEKWAMETAKKKLGPTSARKIGIDGWPDVIFFPGGTRHFWVEFKAPGGKVRSSQKIRIAQMLRRGERVYLIDSREAMKVVFQIWGICEITD